MKNRFDDLDQEGCSDFPDGGDVDFVGGLGGMGRGGSVERGGPMAVEASELETVAGASAPRRVIRGANDHGSLGIGWLQGSLPMVHFDGLCDLLNGLFGECEMQKKTLLFRDTLLVYANGVLIAFDDGGGERVANRCVLRIPAQACESLSPSGLLGLLHSLDELAFKCTRIDESYDDFQWRTTPQEVLKLAIDGDVGGFKKFSHAGDGDVGGRGYKGFTTYLGKRGDNGGGKLGRIYDKNAESEGAIDAVRWEVEWTKEKAQEVFRGLADCYSVEDFGILVAAHIGGAFSFPIRDGRKGHRYRCAQHDFWVDILRDLGSAVVRVQRKKPDYETAKAAFAFQWASFLSIAEVVERAKSGPDGLAAFVEECIAEGMGRQSARHRRMLEEALARVQAAVGGAVCV